MEKEKTILLVEDESPLREAIKFKLEQKRFRVLEAPTGEEALALLEEQEKAPDLVWLDILLPGMSGVDVLNKMREIEKTKHTKVVIVSVSITAEHIKHLEDLGVLECIVKSNFPLQEIIDKVVAHVS